MSAAPVPPLLSVEGLSMRFGGIVALKEVSFHIGRGSILALIGPNGAGKTTVFNCLTGFYRPTRGAVTLQDGERSVDLVQRLGERLQPGDFLAPARLASRLYYKMFGGSHQVARAGVARTFQNIRLFREMTAIENLLVAQHLQVNRNPVAGLFGSADFRAREQEAVQRACYWLKVFGMLEDANRLAGELPYGRQRRLEMARAMCTNPCLLCLDEPAAGLNPQETDELRELIRMLRDSHGVTVLLIEHDMGMVMGVSDRVVVLDHGEVIARGTPREVENDPAVLTAYLGTDYAAGKR